MNKSKEFWILLATSNVCHAGRHLIATFQRSGGSQQHLFRASKIFRDPAVSAASTFPKQISGLESFSGINMN